jgi:hypothetical protein
MVRLAAVASLLLALAVTAMPATAKAPKPNPCKGPKAKKTCPSSIPYIVTVRYTGTETSDDRQSAGYHTTRTRTITWSMRTPQPVKLYHVRDASLGDVSGVFTGKGMLEEKITTTTYGVCAGVNVTREESFAGEASEIVYLVSSLRGGPVVRPKIGPVVGTYSSATGGYTCTQNGNEIRLAPHSESGTGLRSMIRLVNDGGRKALFSVGNRYGDWAIHPNPVSGTYTAPGGGVTSSWSWTWNFQRAD